jgi:hypothetical protein
VNARLQAVLGVITVCAIPAAVFLYRYRPPDRAIDASSIASGDRRGRGPQRAFDSDVRTEWQAEDLSGGVLERRFAEPRPVSAIHLVNGRNEHGVDRYHIDLLREDGDRITTVRGRMEPGQRRTHDVRADGVARIQVVVESFHGMSAALAELAVEPALRGAGPGTTPPPP